MKNAPNLWTLRDLFVFSGRNSAEINGKYVPARPMGWDSIPSRVKIAWKVFTGKADAVTWPGGQ